MYADMPEAIAPDKADALVLLHYCGENALPRLRRLADNKGHPQRWAAVTALQRIEQAGQGEKAE
jgi:hypothetical protein